MPNPIRILMVDDEATSRQTLRNLLQMGCPEAQILGEAGSVADATRLIRELSPDLILLDILLVDGTGFDLLDHFPDPGFKIIFTTAHDAFALRAFQYSALNYLLKPVDFQELAEAVRRVAALENASQQSRQLEQLRHNTSTKQFDRITLSTGDGLLFIRTEEIMHLEANGNYSFVYLENGERHLTAQSLTVFEDILPNPPFFRVHQSHMVNTAYVRKMDKKDGDNLLMTDKSIVPLARRRKDSFIALMGKN